MDSLVEQLVKRKRNYKYYLNIVLTVIAAVLIPVTFIIIAEVTKRAYFIYIAFFLSLFCIYGAWYMISSFNIEYEYAILGSVFRVDKIIAKRKRKKVLKLDVKEIEDFFKYSEEEMNKRSFTKLYFVGTKDYSNDNYVATFNNEEKGKCALIFSPKEKTLDAMKPYFNRTIIKNIYLGK